MKILNNSKKIEAIAWARQIEKNIRSTSAETADAICSEIEKLDEHKLTIAVVGLLKRGKSTFCNAFLGRNDDMLSPIGRFPTTGIITEFAASSDRDGAQVIFENQSSLDISYEDIRDYVTEEGNPENKKNVFKVKVYGKFDLDKEVVLIDLPGDESIHAYHSEIVYNYLPNADVIIFLSDATDPISRSELSLLRKVETRDMKKIFFVINKADKCDDEELADAELHDRETSNNAGIEIESIYSISAKKVMNGEKENFDFQRLMTDISEFLSNDRNELLLRSFCGRVMALAKPVIQNLQQQETLSSIDISELEEKIRELKDKKSKMSSELEKGLEEFSDNWDDMLKEFEDALPEIRENVERIIIGEVEASSMFALGKKQIEKLPEKISETMEKEFSAACGILEERARESLEKLEKSCPSVASFLSDQNIDLTPQGETSSTGGWIFTLVSGSTAYITGSAITGAFTVVSWGGSGFWGTLASIGGSIVNTTVGGVTTAILGPLFLVAAVSATIGFTAMTVSFLRKKKLQKENLIHDLKQNIRTAFDSIKLKRIPYLREQKQVFIDEIKKSFRKTLEELEKNLADAIAFKAASAENTEITQKRQLLLTEYSSLEQQVIEG